MTKRIVLDGSQAAHLGVVVCAVLAVVGCTESSSPTARDALRSPRSNESVAQAAARPLGLEEEYLAMERDAPGFGGMFVAPDGHVVAYAVDEKGTPAIREVVSGFIERHPVTLQLADGRAPVIEVRRGDFSMSQLVGWKTVIRTFWSASLPINLLDADEGRNRVRIGVSDSGAIKEITDLAVSHGIPASALYFE